MTLRKSLILFEQRGFAKKITFGDAVHQHYIHFFLTEA